MIAPILHDRSVVGPITLHNNSKHYVSMQSTQLESLFLWFDTHLTNVLWSIVSLEMHFICIRFVGTSLTLARYPSKSSNLKFYQIGVFSKKVLLLFYCSSTVWFNSPVWCL